jgi:hypothetical protein
MSVTTGKFPDTSTLQTLPTTGGNFRSFLPRDIKVMYYTIIHNQFVEKKEKKIYVKYHSVLTNTFQDRPICLSTSLCLRSHYATK